MGACASKFNVLKSSGGTPPPEDLTSRDYNLADEKVQQDVGKPVAADDEPKRQLLGHLLKEAETAGGVRENDDKESFEVKQEQVKLQEDENVKPPTESLVAHVEHKSKEEVKEAQDMKPVSEDVETAASQKAAEGKPVGAENFRLENPDEIGKQCLETTVEDKTAMEDAKESGVVKDAEMPFSEKHEPGMTTAETEKEEEPKPASAEMETKVGIEIRMEAKDDEKPALVKEEESENKEAETSGKFEVHGTEKLETEIETKTQEKCYDQEPVKIIEVEVEKPAAAASDVEKKQEEDEPTAAGTSTTKKAETHQPGAAALVTELPSDDKKPEVKTSS